MVRLQRSPLGSDIKNVCTAMTEEKNSEGKAPER